MMNQQGEITVAVVLLLTFLSGLGITLIGVKYDHHLDREEAKKTVIENQVDWSQIPKEEDYQ